MENIKDAVCCFLDGHNTYDEILSMYFDQDEVRVVYKFTEDRQYGSKALGGFVIDSFFYKYGNVEVCYKRLK